MSHAALARLRPFPSAAMSRPDPADNSLETPGRLDVRLTTLCHAVVGLVADPVQTIHISVLIAVSRLHIPEPL